MAAAAAAVERRPHLTPEEATELYLLRRHLGIEPSDALERRPAWEVELLARGLMEELGVTTNPADDGYQDADLELPDVEGI